jgi:hypothetical protein
MVFFIIPFPSPDANRGHSLGVKKVSGALPLLFAQSTKCLSIFAPISAAPSRAINDMGANCEPLRLISISVAFTDILFLHSPFY